MFYVYLTFTGFNSGISQLLSVLSIWVAQSCKDCMLGVFGMFCVLLAEYTSLVLFPTFCAKLPIIHDYFHMTPSWISTDVGYLYCKKIIPVHAWLRKKLLFVCKTSLLREQPFLLMNKLASTKFIPGHLAWPAHWLLLHSDPVLDTGQVASGWRVDNTFE